MSIVNRAQLVIAGAILALPLFCGGCTTSWGQPGGMQMRALTIPYSRAHDVDALRDADPVERRWALLRLMQRADGTGAAEIARLVSRENESVPLVRATAATALRVIGGRDQLETLLANLDDPDPLARREIIAAIGVLGTPAETPSVAALLRDRDEDVRIQAVESLGRMSGMVALPHLIPMLEDRASSVRFAARAALIDLSGADQGRGRARWQKWLESQGRPETQPQQPQS